MVTGLVKELVWVSHFEPFAGGCHEIGILYRQVAYHVLEVVASVPVDDQHLPHALVMEVGHKVGEYGPLCLIAIMHAERQVALSGIL